MLIFGRFLAPGLYSAIELPALRNAEGGGGAGGGGGGGDGGGTGGAQGGAGGGDSKGGGSGGQSGEIDPQLRDFVMRTVNGAITGHLERKLGPAIEGALNPFLEKLKTGGAGAGAGGQGGKGGDNKGDSELANQVAAMKAQLEERDRKLADTERKAAEGRRDALLGEALDAIGVDPNRKRGAHAVALGNLATLEDGSVIWRAQRKGYTEDLSIADGLKEWAQTDEGKAYLKATDAGGGTGTRPAFNGGRPGVRSSDPKVARAQAKREASEKLMASVRGLVGSGQVRIN